MGRVEPERNSRSPWAALYDREEVEIHPPTKPPDGAIAVPGSKSYTNRAILISALAEGSSILGDILRSDDSYWCLNALQQLGVSLQVEGNTVSIEGTGGEWPNPAGSLYIGAAGTIARFLPGALAAGSRGSWLLEGNRRLSERPVRPLIKALNTMGADIRYTADIGQLPIRIEARGLAGGKVTVSGAVSSQFLSGLLIASPYAKQRTEIRVADKMVQHAYVGMTIELMKRYGVVVEHNEAYDHFIIEPERYQGQNVQLEADASTSCYFLAYAALTGGHIRITNLTAATLQPDFGMLKVFERMGCKVNSDAEGIELWGPEMLQGGFTISMREMSDQTLTLAALAPFADAPITITDVEHIRTHECDRISAMCDSLTRLGIQVEERRDGLTVHPGMPAAGEALDTYDDHRMAMSLALIGSRVGGLRLRDPGCVSKTCPSYFEDMRKLGLQVII
ncbi:3-phosphoshikimate 1-carboxyvinyltransferase [Paenibacillus radicis (ex Xue et al. 2023)]|uniref:3-phosphoshikimate 1-carboxyvinyltransferase n=1 Tax=Paenibacillus radicis (ex Xue et al. 2023) TaxID=2972489 RepID=A0ABT1YUH7_9BACL|nr:3-phosphoshikimate 1-carboxyvinyltransferase [Paenibacillus radicis (ex Xue et al. 2023)]MCR8636575.1 3-phosphoshikimate 1-carboxyvinyltransferase [Paenibacillus radicis (ex Xue et al. 2023)]